MFTLVQEKEVEGRGLAEFFTVYPSECQHRLGKMRSYCTENLKFNVRTRMLRWPALLRHAAKPKVIPHQLWDMDLDASVK